jgi:hypothetical protein
MQMAKHDDLLEQALAEIAMEETNRLKAQLHDPALRDAADSLYVRHRSRLLPKLRARKKRRSYARFFQLAASVLLVIGAWQVFKQPVKDMLNKPVPLTSGAPTFVPATPALLETPTLVPATATAAPTASPSPESTATPTLAPTPLADAWGGTYFVTSKEKYTLKGLVPGTMHRAEFADADGNAYTFAEYPQPTLHDIEKGAQLQYVHLPDGTVALTAEGPQGAQVIWDVDGRTLSVFTQASLNEALAMAGDIQKIK